VELFARRASTWEEVAFSDNSIGRTEAGVRVNHDTALSDDAILAAVSLLAGDIASLPMRALTTTETGLTQPLKRQPAWIEAPDPFDLAITDVAHRTQLALSLLLAGNSYTLCEPSIFDPQRLTVLDPTRVRVVKPGNERLFEIMGRSSTDGTWTPRDVLETLSSAQVLHIPYLLRPGRLEGLSPIDAQAGNLGISLAMRKWVETFFGKGGQVSGLVSLPVGASGTDVEEVQARVQSRWSSWKRAGVIGVLAGGATWIKTGLSPQDADLGALWRRQLEMAARIYGIPPFMIGSQEPAGVAYASSVERSQHYIDHCINRYTRPIEKAYSRLVPGDNRLAVAGSNTEVRFVFDAFLRGDPKARWETYLAGLQAKARTIGEIRALENLPPLSDYDAAYLEGPDGLLETPNNNSGASDSTPTDDTQAAPDAGPMPGGPTA
jgi:HK97 family phage portal protein